MEYLSTDNNDIEFDISELIGNGSDAGDDMMAFMEDALSEESCEDSGESTVNAEVPNRGMTDAELTMLIDALESTHRAKSMLFSTKEEIFFYNSDLCRSFYIQEKVNEENCLI